MRSPAWSGTNQLVAESLAALDDPPAAGLRPGPEAPPRAVAAAIARSLAPEEARVGAPAWLREAQLRPFRLALAALERFGGALLAEPVGSGKTWIALAVARVLSPNRDTDVLAPATLLDQWRRTAARLEVPIRLTSHERASRGHLPRHHSPLVVIDESHHFRNPATQRHRHTAPWLVGARVLLVSATPVVNRPEDLLHQLLLAVPDDVLLGDGIASLSRAIMAGELPATLGRLLVASPGTRPTGVRRRERTVPAAQPSAAWCAVLDGIDRLMLSTSPPIATLVRSVLWRALASSPAALGGSLRRYQRLLLHARDAQHAGGGSGALPSRQWLRALTGSDDAQLVMWSLLGDGAEAPDAGDLCLHDAAALDRLIQQAAVLASGEDPKAARLALLLHDHRPTLVFSCSRDTVTDLRRRLVGAAWCTGQRAGIGATSMSRSAVLAWFAPDGRIRPDVARLAPRVLVATDVAAEGLDLQRAARVVHYDLPWTAVRLEQRVGRVDRLGAHHTEVEVVRFALPAPLETRLGQELTLARKTALPACAGLGARGETRWRWRAAVADRWRGRRGIEGVAGVRGDAGVLATVSLEWAELAPPFRSVIALWGSADGAWTDDPAMIMEALEQAMTAEPLPLGTATLRAAIGRLEAEVKRRVRLTRDAHWTAPTARPEVRRLLAQLRRLARRTARERDRARLDLLDRAMRFVAGGHTTGEMMRIAELAALPDQGVLAALSRLPSPRPVPGAPRVRLTGLIVFGEAGAVRSE